MSLRKIAPFLPVLCVFLCAVGGRSAALSCLNEQGKPVDWFIAYKIPKIAESSYKLVQEGLGHVYMDANKQDVAYILYDDELPNDTLAATSTNRGHTKGVLVFDKSRGYWLVHSTPKFPNPAKESYSWPENAVIYGQSFLCISFQYREFEKIGQQLLYTWPRVYDSQLPAAFAADFPSLSKVLKGQHVGSSPWNQTLVLTSTGGQQFHSFVKFGTFDADIYADWLAPYFQSELLTETWQNGAGKLDSFCGKYKVLNIKEVKLPNGIRFTSTKDHSKWAVTQDTGSHWTCIGGLNRQMSQEERPGGTVCVNHPQIWHAFINIISELETCTKTQD
ncbi:PREDICTED: plancitoxin-1-like [Branchiostoma belcheri]|uniref:deoxyribonuclease II n=1 Tax=Branchiostoma belcheri TaxID=7741 RepID=A0A6P5A2K7_BRABE|nr:PREDICTED: plancitoxin-1-like [Branchiostoma belcheri]